MHETKTTIKIAATIMKFEETPHVKLSIGDTRS